MNEIQKLIERIQAIILDTLEPNPQEIEKLNSELINAVETVNDRLRHCDAYLQKGLRPEAIQLCEKGPNLLDLIAVLDFADWDVWVDIVRERQLDAPVDMMLDTASALNSAYNLEMALENPLKEHRLLALGLAPLSQRLSVMRTISSIDVDNQTWQDDILDFENERYSQIRNEVQQAARQRNVSALATIERELNSPEWASEPPKKLITMTSRAHKKCRVQLANDELQTLEPKLTEAFSELDVEKARQLRSRWNGLLQIAEPAADDPIMELVAPTMEWLSQTDIEQKEEYDYQQEIVKLEAGLSQRKSKEVLQQRYHAATKTGRELPEHLFQRYTDHISHQEIQSQRKFSLIVATSVVSLLVVGVMVGFMIRQQNRSKEIETHVAALNSLIDSSKQDQAKEYLENISEIKWVHDSPQIQELSANLEAIIIQESGRKEMFQTVLNRIRDIEFSNGKWESIDRATSELNNIEVLAMTNGEKIQYEQLKLDIQREKNRIQDITDTSYRKDLDTFIQQVATLPKEEAVVIKKAMMVLGELEKRPRVTDSLKKDLSKLRTLLEGKRDVIRRNVSMNRDYQAISKSIGDYSQYQKSLDSYVLNNSGTTRAKDFENISKNEIAIWKNIKSWNLLKQEWRKNNPQEMTPKKAKQLIEGLDNLVKESKYLSVPEAITKILPVVKAIASREDENGDPSYNQLIAVLEDRLFSSLNMVLTNDRRRYYTLDEPRYHKKSDKYLVFNGYTAMSLANSEENNLLVSTLLMSGEPDKVDWSSPQKRFSKYAINRLNQKNKDSWETIFLDVLQELHSDKYQDMDPILKYQLMGRFLDVACLGSFPMQEVFADELKTLSLINVDPAANWMDPDDSRANLARITIVDKLVNIKDPGKKRGRVNELLGKLSTSNIGPLYDWVGWLSRNADGKFIMRFDPDHSPVESGKLVVINISGSNVEEYQQVGKIEDKKISFNQPDTKTISKQIYVEGRAIFLEKD